MIIKVNKLKEIGRNNSKRLSSKFVKQINEILENEAREIIRKAAVKSDFRGRKTIKKEDIQ